MDEHDLTEAEQRKVLTCPECEELFTDTVVFPEGHTVCWSCAYKSTSRSRLKCPEYGVAYHKKYPRNDLFQEMMQKVTAKCKFDGCEEVFPLSKKERHEEELRSLERYGTLENSLDPTSDSAVLDLSNGRITAQ